MSEQAKRTALLSAGGTGGHFFPALALADDLLKRNYKVVFVTDDRGAKYSGRLEGVTFKVLKAGTPAGKGIWGKVKGIIKLGVGTLQALQFVKSVRPDIAIGFGGYPSVPAIWAAQKYKIPTILHEQNATMGKANAFLAGKSNRIALSLPIISGLNETDRFKCVITGNPVRPEIVKLYSDPYQLPQDGDKFRVFVMGGSLGATVFSQVVPKAIEMLPKEIFEKVHITQQVREADMDETKEVYQKLGADVTLQTFFDDMAAQLGSANLIICRAGASTVAEITTAGRPAIYVPYPHHADQQQKMNAQAVTQSEGGWLMEEGSEFTPEKLAQKLETLISDPQKLFNAAEKSREHAKPDAARKLGNLVVALTQGWEQRKESGTA